MQKWKKYILITDIIALYLSLILAILVRGVLVEQAIQNESVWIAAHTIIFLPSLIFSIVSLYVASLYDAKTIYDKGQTVVLLFYAQFASLIFSVTTFYFLKTDLTPKFTLFLYAIISVITLTVTRTFVFSSLQKGEKMKALFLGAQDLLDKVEAKYAPFTLERIDSLDSMVDKKVSAVIFDEKVLDKDVLLKLENLKSRNVMVYSYSQYFEFLFKKVDLDNVDLNSALLNFAEMKETRAHFIFRKFIDFFCGLLILPAYLLSLPFVYIGIFLQDRGVLLSKQDRVSYLGKRVWLYKIRTMTSTDVGGIVPDGKEKNDKSKFGNIVTPFGKFLRKTRIDELPQCLNLLKGDVSMIGPRADIIGVHTDMKENIDNYVLRLLVPQGLTGWAQVHMNFPPRTHAEHRERLAYELFYIKNRGVFIDISIILKTIKTLLGREGA